MGRGQAAPCRTLVADADAEATGGKDLSRCVANQILGHSHAHAQLLSEHPVQERFVSPDADELGTAAEPVAAEATAGQRLRRVRSDGGAADHDEGRAGGRWKVSSANISREGGGEGAEEAARSAEQTAVADSSFGSLDFNSSSVLKLRFAPATPCSPAPFPCCTCSSFFIHPHAMSARPFSCPVCQRSDDSVVWTGPSNSDMETLCQHMLCTSCHMQLKRAHMGCCPICAVDMSDWQQSHLSHDALYYGYEGYSTDDEGYADVGERFLDDELFFSRVRAVAAVPTQLQPMRAIDVPDGDVQLEQALQTVERHDGGESLAPAAEVRDGGG